MEKRKNNLVNAISDDNWGKPVPIEHNFSIEEMLDMPTEGEVQMNLANNDCVGQDDLYNNESHGECNHELFGVTGKDSDYIEIDDLY